MHGTVYTFRDGIRVIPPYGGGAFDYKRPHRDQIITAVYHSVQDFLNNEGRKNPNAWWNRRPYAISVRPDYSTRGTYIYHVSPTD